RQHQPRVRTLAHQTADHAFERTVDHLDHHPFANERTGVELQIALHETANAVDLMLGNRNDLAVERHDVDDTGALEHGKTIGAVETDEAVAGKQRPIDLLLAILPAAPLRDRGQERLDPLAFELLAHHLLV